MRLTEFRELLDSEFGASRGEMLMREHCLGELGGRTGNAAVEGGVDPKEVWRAMCAEFDVPRDRW